MVASHVCGQEKECSRRSSPLGDVTVKTHLSPCVVLSQLTPCRPHCYPRSPDHFLDSFSSAVLGSLDIRDRAKGIVRDFNMNDYHDDCASQTGSNHASKTATAEDAAQYARLERKTITKLDLLLVPSMSILYLLAFLDRTNVGNARVAGLQTDLKISDTQYQTALTVTYVPYILAELPSNLILNRIGPRVLLPTICILWGLVSSLQSQVNNYAGLLACRFFLGLVEGGLFPGIVLYLSGKSREEPTCNSAIFR
jgi:hypothetical protein